MLTTLKSCLMVDCNQLLDKYIFSAILTLSLILVDTQMKKYKLTFKLSIIDPKPNSITKEMNNRFEANEWANNYIKNSYPARQLHSTHMNYEKNEIIYLLI